ncbi:hypothetical protein TUMEXPCC7403_13935 [Tumidithrix helvetica PCC 7403]|uniref:hypothetical protein n=1 Tax=Tumidithrix helvetica TaxID=3457545 RepID=UPI003C8F3E93
MQFSFIPTNPFVFLGKAIENLFRAVFDRSDEVKVWQETDRKGNLYWSTYDPKTGECASFGSELEVMRWIESRYYF